MLKLFYQKKDKGRDIVGVISLILAFLAFITSIPYFILPDYKIFFPVVFAGIAFFFYDISRWKFFAITWWYDVALAIMGFSFVIYPVIKNMHPSYFLLYLIVILAVKFIIKYFKNKAAS